MSHVSEDLRISPSTIETMKAPPVKAWGRRGPRGRVAEQHVAGERRHQ
jgi:hypothetical protein